MLRRRLFRLYEYGVTIESSTTYDSHLRNDCIVTRRPEWRVGGARSRTHTRAPFYTPPLRLTSAPGLRGLSRTPASRDPDSLPDRDAGAAVHASQRAELSGHRGAAEARSRGRPGHGRSGESDGRRAGRPPPGCGSSRDRERTSGQRRSPEVRAVPGTDATGNVEHRERGASALSVNLENARIQNTTFYAIHTRAALRPVNDAHLKTRPCLSSFMPNSTSNSQLSQYRHTSVEISPRLPHALGVTDNRRLRHAA